MSVQSFPTLPEDNIRFIAESMVMALDEIDEDVQLNGLITQNGSPGRLWDFIHTSLFNKFRDTSIVAKPSRHGAWQMLPLIDRRTGVLYNLMKEKNFRQLQRKEVAERKKHYIAALVHAINSDLPIFSRQLCMFPDNESIDEDFVQTIISQLTSDLEIPLNIIQRHSLILFQNEMGQLRSFRCCIINSNFEIVASQNWNQYIPYSDSTIVEIASAENDPHNNPTQNLILSQKAKKRIDQNQKIRLFKPESIEENNED